MYLISTIEHLPNEILLECFKYLTLFDLFPSSDHLNNRFSTLIRSISLDVNFKNAPKSTIENFCLKLQKDPSIKTQIRSLHLFNKQSLNQTDIFLSNFSHNEFFCLKSLSLTTTTYEDQRKLTSLLSLVENLCSFNLYLQYDKFFDMPDDISISKLQQLRIPSLFHIITTTEKPWCMKNLTLTYVSITQVVKIFECAPCLINLTTEYIGGKTEDETKMNRQRNVKEYPAMYLKRLKIGNCGNNFLLMDTLLKLTPNLKVFNLIVRGGTQMIDAARWQNLITSSLKHLSSFQFQFSFTEKIQEIINDIRFQFNQFQGEFWQKQHHWYIQCEISTSFVTIYTIPYQLNEYTLYPSTEHYCSTFVNMNTVFDRVTDLSISYPMIQTLCSYKFSNVKILRLRNDITSKHIEQSQSQKQVLDIEHIQCLKQFICFSRITDLLISTDYILSSPLVMINLLKEAPNISSLAVDSQVFRWLDLDEQLCLSLKRMIKKFVIYESDNIKLFNDTYSIEEFCQHFPYLEQLECHLSNPEELITLLHGLCNLTEIEVVIPFPTSICTYFISQFWSEQLLTTLKTDFHLNEDNMEFQYESIQVVVRIYRSIE